MAAAKKAPATIEGAAEALRKSLAGLVSAAASYAEADTGRTIHSFTAEGYRIQFMGEQLSSVVPM